MYLYLYIFPYLASLHDPSNEPLAHAAFNFDFETMPQTKASLKALIAEEVISILIRKYI